MTFARALFEDLRSKPVMLVVAIVLLVALVAVPILLSKPAKAPQSATVPPKSAAPTDNAQTVADVKQLTPPTTPFYERQGKSVRVFPRKNPFASRASSPAGAGAGVAGTATPIGTTGATGVDTTGSDGASQVPVDSGGGTTGGSGGEGGGTSYYTWVAKVRFGKEGDKLEKKTLEGLRSLPSSTNPILVFLGVSSDGKDAVFLLSSSATTTGDGRCAPSDDECSFIYMKKKDSQTIEAVSADGNVTTYELKLDEIDAKKISNPSASSSSKKKALKSQSKKLRRVEVKKHKRQAKRQAKRQQNRIVNVLDKIGF